MKNLILKTAVFAALTASVGAQAFTVTPGLIDTHLMPNGGKLHPGMTIDGNNIYRLRGNSNTPEIIAKYGKHTEIGINIYDKAGAQTGRFSHSRGGSFLNNLSSHKGNIITSYEDVGSVNKITRYDTTAIDDQGNPFTRVTEYTVDFGESNAKIGSGVAFDSDNGVFYFQKKGSNSTVSNRNDIYKYEIDSGNLDLFSTQLKQPGINDTTISVDVDDMEFVNGAIWMLEDSNGQAARFPEDNDTTGIFKMNLDGSLAGFDKFDSDSTGFNMESGLIGGFDYDEESGSFFIEAELDWTGADPRDGFYIAQINDLELEIGAPSAVPVPAALPLFGFGIAGLSFFGKRRKKS